LLTRQTLLCGTIMPNRKNFPKRLVKKKMDRGSSKILYNGSVGAIAWGDKRPIYFVSSTKVSAPNETVLRYNATEHRRVEVNCPKAVKCYNQFMGGTDRNDQLTRLQRVRRHYSWPRRLTIKFFMWAVYNSYVIQRIFCPHTPGKRITTFHMYIEKLCNQLVGNFRRDTPTFHVRNPALLDGRLVNEPDRPIHIVERAENATGNNRCVVCTEINRRARLANPHAANKDLPKCKKTMYKCRSCNVFLCVGTGETNCFHAYHSKVQYWRR